MLLKAENAGYTVDNAPPWLCGALVPLFTKHAVTHSQHTGIRDSHTRPHYRKSQDATCCQGGAGHVKCPSKVSGYS